MHAAHFSDDLLGVSPPPSTKPQAVPDTVHVQRFPGNTAQQKNGIINVVSRTMTAFQPTTIRAVPESAEEWLSLAGAYIGGDGSFPVKPPEKSRADARSFAAVRAAMARNPWMPTPDRIDTTLELVLSPDAPAGTDFVIELHGPQVA